MTPKLKLLQIDLTDECPLFCAHCSNSSGPGCNAHFPIRKLLEIIREAIGLGLEKLIYSGGEPLCYRHLDEALSAAHFAGIPTAIFTTGIQSKKTRLPISANEWRKLRDRGLVAAAFSIYAGPSNRDHHNAVVRTRPAIGDAFGVNEQAIRDAHSVGILTELHFIPSAVSVPDLPEIYAWAVGLGCSLVNLQVPTYQGRNKEEAFLELNAHDEDRLKQAASALPVISGGTGFYISRFWQSRWKVSPKADCVANLEQLVVRADGTVSPCNACKYGSVTIGSENLLAEGATLADLWRHSRTLQELREARGTVQLPRRCEGVLAINGVKVLQRTAS
jgi:MoaA/NifB/PqqE/SkfB family radical SAM enzyme